MKGPRPKLFSLQADLPRLPVPDLQATCRRYLRSVRALATDDEYAATEQAVRVFLEGDGPTLQRMLLEHSDREWKAGRNWLETWWFEYAYLKWPDPLPLHSNVFFSFLNIPSRDVDHIRQAARIMSCFLSAKGMIEREELPPEMQGNLPLDMSQHKRAFTTVRHPGPTGDTLHVLNPSSQVLVICHHRFYLITAEDARGQPVCAQLLEKQLRSVWSAAHSSPAPEHSVGMLTSEMRPVWAAQYAELMPLNRAEFEAIDKAMAVFVLEDTEPASQDEVLTQICGGDASNRWFDKGTQVVVFRNALSGMNAEHSPAEATMHEAVWGVPLFQRMRDLGPWAYPDTYREPAEPLAPVRELLFKPTPGLPQALEAAAQRYRADSEDLDCRALLFDEWGGEWAKSQGLPIDSVVQMALQLAWGTLHGQPGVATYETAHLRLFKGAPLAEQKRLFKAATESQKNYMVDAIQAKGCDRHLMGLRLLAMANGMQPGIFTDAMYARSSHWQLSTSTVRTSEIGGFPPVVSDGYGVCYMVWKSGHTIVASVAARKSGGKTSAPAFRDAICNALRTIRTMWEAVPNL